MPAAFKASGLWWGVVATILVSIICTHCAYVLVTSAHALYKKVGKTSMTYPDVAEEACLRGPPWGRKFAFLARYDTLLNCFCFTLSPSKSFIYFYFHFFSSVVYCCISCSLCSFFSLLLSNSLHYPILFQANRPLGHLPNLLRNWKLLRRHRCRKLQLRRLQLHHPLRQAHNHRTPLLTLLTHRLRPQLEVLGPRLHGGQRLHGRRSGNHLLLPPC